MMKPGTPLPWLPTCVGADSHIIHEDKSVLAGYMRVARATNPSQRCKDDMLYIAHTANQYPKLVRALRELLDDCRNDLKPTPSHPAYALLRALGETE